MQSDKGVKFDLIYPGNSQGLFRKLRSGFNGFLKLVTGLDKLQKLYVQVQSTATGDRFTDKILSCIGARLQIAERGLGRIPKSGRLVVVANHPFGGIESAALASLLLSVRRDVKFLANHFLARVPELDGLILPVDPFHGPDSARSNLGSIKKAIQWVRSGGVLAIFPAGEVAHFQLHHGRVSDPVWQESIGQLLRVLKAPVLPVFFPGRNGLFFQIAGLIHPRIRTALLVREFLNKGGRVIGPRIGRPIA